MRANITLGEWEFWVTESDGRVFLAVPDCGGMADMIPKVPAQLAWAEQHLAGLPLVQVWATTWEVPPGALPSVQTFFEGHGARWSEG